ARPSAAVLSPHPSPPPLPVATNARQAARGFGAACGPIVRKRGKPRHKTPKADPFGAAFKPTLRLSTALVGEEDRLDLRLYLLFGLIARDRDLLHDERAGRVEHTALAERELLVRLQAVQVAEHFGDVVNRARLDLVHEAAVAAVPRLVVECDRPLAEDVEDLA